jgi:hypothetical protein
VLAKLAYKTFPALNNPDPTTRSIFCAQTKPVDVNTLLHMLSQVRREAHQSALAHALRSCSANLSRPYSAEQVSAIQSAAPLSGRRCDSFLRHARALSVAHMCRISYQYGFVLGLRLCAKCGLVSLKSRRGFLFAIICDGLCHSCTVPVLLCVCVCIRGHLRQMRISHLSAFVPFREN